MSGQAIVNLGGTAEVFQTFVPRDQTDKRFSLWMKVFFVSLFPEKAKTRKEKQL